MKIRVVLTVEVDPAAWDTTFGSSTIPAEVREDVRSYALGCVQQSAGVEETGATVTLA